MLSHTLVSMDVIKWKRLEARSTYFFVGLGMNDRQLGQGHIHKGVNIRVNESRLRPIPLD